MNCISYRISVFLTAIVAETEPPSQVVTESEKGTDTINLMNINPSEFGDILGHVSSEMEQLDSKTMEDLFKDVTVLPLLPQQPGTGDPMAPQAPPASGTPTGNSSL